MIKISLNIAEHQRVELVEHLKLNGYSVEWETESVLLVNIDDVEYIKTILLDRKIPFYYIDANVIEEAKNCLKQKLDSFYRLAEEILMLSSSNEGYSDDEEELFEEVANVVNVFDNFVRKTKGMSDYGKVLSEIGTPYSVEESE